LKADRAGAHQQQALESLQFARRDLQNEIQRLLDELSGEVRGRVIDTLKRMLEQQTAVREQTQSLGPKAAEGSRQAVASIVALAEREGKIIALADEIITLVEETEFGVALPAALRAVRDEMSSVQSRLKEADASDAVVALQKQIEEDLSALLDAMKRMLSTRKPQSSDPGNLQVRERELNRLVAELKMVRLLQLRVNKETVGVDGKRPMPPAEVPAGVKQEISGVEKRQDAVRSTTEKLSERLEP
jgi:hypothetical protein